MSPLDSRFLPILASLGALGALIAAFVVLGGLAPAWAAVGLICGAAWIVAARRDTLGSGHRSSARPEGLEGEAHAGSLWRQVLDAVPDPALMLDPDRDIMAANPAAESLFPGCSGRHITHVARDPELLGAVGRAASLGTRQAFEMHTVAPVEQHLSGVVAPLTVSGPGVGPALLLIIRDRTEVERTAQLRADFVANASHELRTPLASLRGFVETLQGAAKDDAKARAQFLVIMQEQAERMSRLIDDLLSLSRIEMREHLAPTGAVDLLAIATTAARGLAPVAERAGIRLNLPDMVAGLTVAGDADELGQVAQNLIQNAIRYGRRGGRVDVTVTREGPRVSLKVADDGIGIAPEHLPRLTERFYRVSAKQSRERGGTGLGLAIVKHIVNRHRGELRIESEPERGSIFTVFLPASPRP
jgi:two-component system phosphate regulon sensor histidine kinase PhoR